MEARPPTRPGARFDPAARSSKLAGRHEAHVVHGTFVKHVTLPKPAFIVP